MGQGKKHTNISEYLNCLWHQNRACKSWQLLVYQLDWFYGPGKKLKPLLAILLRFVWIWCYFYYTIYSAVDLRFGVNKIANKPLKWFSAVNMDAKCWFKSCHLLHARERLYRAFIVFFHFSLSEMLYKII